MTDRGTPMLIAVIVTATGLVLALIGVAQIIHILTETCL